MLFWPTPKLETISFVLCLSRVRLNHRRVDVFVDRHILLNAVKLLDCSPSCLMSDPSQSPPYPRTPNRSKAPSLLHLLSFFFHLSMIPPWLGIVGLLRGSEVQKTNLGHRSKLIMFSQGPDHCQQAGIGRGNRLRPITLTMLG